MSGKSPQGTVLDLLSRRVSVDALPHLVGALRRDVPEAASFDSWAIGFDANVLLNLAKGRRGADLVDYLGKLHNGPIVLPSQAIQEFWNNRIYAVSGLADGVRTAFAALEKRVTQIDPAFSGFGAQLEPILRQFEADFGHVLDDRTVGDLDALLTALTDVSCRAEVDRSSLYPIARQRKLAKTPPGFKDEGDGDFLIWADFLLGLQLAREEGKEFPAAALVTDDTKKDWSTKGTTNPILAAEVHSLVGVPFITLTLDKFNERVRETISGSGGSEAAPSAEAVET